MSEAAVCLKVRDQTLLLHPERAVEWRERRAVIVADTHFGKGGIFRRHGMPVPAGSDESDRQRLTALLRRVDARTLIVLGDFLHGPLSQDSEDARAIDAWSQALRPIDIHVVAGNHDRGVRQLWHPRVHWRDQDWLDGPFLLTHHADETPGSGAPFAISGHVHPVVRLGGLRKRAPRIPVFWQRDGGLVLPSFGIFTGGFVIKPGPRDRIFAAGPERVIPF